ncbi:DUF6069 family protein [Actinomadura rugatobispora]|uniref:DUF6069 family protein n=1 Tax=Actinomadura rugatobispora TaxID=1994 RepID=A0ABW1ADG1_9ACTN|nr:hypothetical protein GCM10010200_073940 [Actinomadura rugatobispora]
MVAERSRTAGTGARRRGRVIAVAATVLAAVLVWLVAVAAGQDLVVAQPGREAQEVDVVPVLLFSLVPSLLGWALLAALERFAAARALVVWTAAALVVLLVSFVPLLQVEAAGSTKATLALLHVVVAAVLVPGFWRTAGRREPAAAGG